MAHDVIVLRTHVEVRFRGVVDRESVGGLSAAETESLRRTRRLLFDFCEVTEFRFDTMQLGDAMQRLASQGVRLAICSEGPAMFGVGRQIALASNLEGLAIQVCRSRDEAVTWLARAG